MNDMTAQLNNQAIPDDDRITPSEAAKILGVSLMTFHRWRHTQVIPKECFTILTWKTIQVRKSELLKWAHSPKEITRKTQGDRR